MATPVTAVERKTESRLQTGVSVAVDDGRLHAIVGLYGELCPVTADGLRAELEQLVEDGVVDMTVDLRHLRFCNSDGLEVFDDIHRALAERHGGTLRLCLGGAPSIVRRTVGLVADRDPTFSPQITGAAPDPDAMAPDERPGDSTS